MTNAATDRRVFIPHNCDERKLAGLGLKVIRANNFNFFLQSQTHTLSIPTVKL